MLMGLFIFILISSGSSIMASLGNKKFEETIASSIIGIILILYIGGILNYLELFMWFAVAICIFFWVISLFGMIKNYRVFIRNFFTPAFVAFIIIYFLLLIIQKNLLLLNWDEFSH